MADSPEIRSADPLLCGIDCLSRNLDFDSYSKKYKIRQQVLFSDDSTDA